MNSNASHATDSLTSRSYENERDLRQMLDLLMEGRSHTGEWHYAHVGDLLFSFFMIACHLDPTQHIRLWHDRERLVGYALLSEDPAFDFQVLPGYEWRGIEEEAIAWADQRIADWIVQSRIEDSLRQSNQAKEQIARAIQGLEDLQTSTQAKMSELQEKRERLIERT